MNDDITEIPSLYSFEPNKHLNTYMFIVSHLNTLTPDI